MRYEDLQRIYNSVKNSNYFCCPLSTRNRVVSLATRVLSLPFCFVTVFPAHDATCRSAESLLSSTIPKLFALVCGGRYGGVETG